MEDSKISVKKGRASLELRMLAGFSKIENVTIPKIPSVRSIFPDTENDWWYEIPFPASEDVSACIYELDTNRSFRPHYHENNNEQIFILTPSGRLKLITSEDVSEITFPNGAFIPKKRKHAVVNLSPFPIKLLVFWSPKMIGWNAEYVNE